MDTKKCLFITPNTNWAINHVSSETCSSIVRCILHFLLYQRNQLPLAFDILSEMSEEIKDLTGDDGNYFIARQRELAVETVNEIRMLTDSIERLIKSTRVKYVAILLGNTTFLAKELYLINLPNVSHTMGCHSSVVGQIILSLIADQRLIGAASSMMPLTNVHVLMRISDHTQKTDDILEFLDYLQVPRSCKPFHINLDKNGSQKEVACTYIESKIEIFSDSAVETLATNYQRMSMDNEEPSAAEEENPNLDDILSRNWYRINITPKGFSDRLRNGDKIWRR